MGFQGFKTDENGRPKFKARLVSHGFTQKYGVDYDEVFAPVARSTTLRFLLSVAGVRKFSVKHFDVQTAFLYGDIKEQIYLSNLLLLVLQKMTRF